MRNLRKRLRGSTVWLWRPRWPAAQRHGSVCRQFDQLDSGRFQRGGAAEPGDGDALQLAVFGRIRLPVVRLFGGDDD